jgi:RecB family endonuclease NucS
MDLTRQQKEILSVVKQAEMPISQGKIADEMGVSGSAVWGNVKKLHERKGILEARGSNPRKYLIDGDIDIDENTGIDDFEVGPESIQPKPDTNISLEDDIRSYLVKNLNNLKEGMTAESDTTGEEYQVDSGFIDILAEDSEGEPVVIEIKAGKAKRDALGQIKAYMADRMAGSSDSVTGIIVAEGFSQQLTKAVTIEPLVELYTFRVKFDFEKY